MIARPPAERGDTPFRHALEQFDRAAAHLPLPDDLRRALRLPSIELQHEIPVPMDDGRLRTFTGYGIQYLGAPHLALTDLHCAPDLELDALRAQALMAAWQSALVNVPVTGLTGGLVCDPATLSTGEFARLARHLAKALTGRQDAALAAGLDSLAAIARPGASAAAGEGAMICADAILRDQGWDQPAAIRVAVWGVGPAARAAVLAAQALGYSVIRGQPRADRRAAPPAPPDSREPEFDVLILCATSAAITPARAATLRARWIVEGASGAVQPAAEALLTSRGVTLVPSLLAGAGGALAVYFGWVQHMQAHVWAADEARQQLRRALVRAYAAVRRAQDSFGVDLRTAAQIVAIRRLAAQHMMLSAVP